MVYRNSNVYAQDKRQKVENQSESSLFDSMCFNSRFLEDLYSSWYTGSTLLIYQNNSQNSYEPDLILSYTAPNQSLHCLIARITDQYCERARTISDIHDILCLYSGQ